MRTLNEEIARIKSEVAEIASKTFTGKTCAENVKKALDKMPETYYNKDTKTKEMFQMEKRYWELREECERTFDRWMADKRESNLNAYKEALSIYQDFCMDILERLMDENADVLKNLKD